LRRINLYSCNISAILLHNLGHYCKALQHLNIGASVQYGPVNASDLNSCLANLRNLVSLDLWRCKFASTSTIAAIANCKNLEEIDIGWCHNILRAAMDHQFLFGSCRKLKKVFLTSGRIVDDACLESIAMFCPEMEQLDVLGSGRVSLEGVARILDSCPRLRLFDVSFCTKIESIAHLVKRYPRVTFKKSFQ
jgi:F-box/leucine-rich repeat protein 4